MIGPLIWLILLPFKIAFELLELVARSLSRNRRRSRPRRPRATAPSANVPWLKIALWVFLLPVMLSIWLSRRSWPDAYRWGAIAAVWVVTVAVIASSGASKQSPSAATPATAQTPASTDAPSTGGSTERASPTASGKHRHHHRHHRHRQQTRTSSAKLPCPSSPLRGVYHSYRLHVLGTCRWYVGVVTSVPHEEDGDYHVDVRPASSTYRHFLDGDNYTEQHGSLVTEIMPGQDLPVPAVGEPVAVFGTWVYDADHGWNEIHPIWAINYRDTHQLLERLPPRTPVYDSGETSGSSGGSGGGSAGGGSNCTPGYSPCLPNHGGADYDCYGRGGNGPYYTQPGVTYTVTGSDPYGLDANHDGRACG